MHSGSDVAHVCSAWLGFNFFLLWQPCTCDTYLLWRLLSRSRLQWWYRWCLCVRVCVCGSLLQTVFIHAVSVASNRFPQSCMRLVAADCRLTSGWWDAADLWRRADGRIAHSGWSDLRPLTWSQSHSWSQSDRETVEGGSSYYYNWQLGGDWLQYTFAFWVCGCSRRTGGEVEDFFSSAERCLCPWWVEENGGCGGCVPEKRWIGTMMDVPACQLVKHQERQGGKQCPRCLHHMLSFVTVFLCACHSLLSRAL